MVTLRSQSNKVHSGQSENEKMEGNPKTSDSQKLNIKKIQLFTFISLVLDLLGFTVILPLFPALLDYYSKNDTSGLYHFLQSNVESVQLFLNIPKQFNSVLFGGVLGSMFSLLQFVSSPICGALSDVYGRKPIVILCLVGICVSYLLWSIASTFAVFVLSRIVGGLSKGNVSLSYSMMTDILDASSRSKGMALIGVAFSIGFIIGPCIGVMFSKWGTTGWFAASAFYAFSMAVINVFFFTFYCEETLPKSKRVKSFKSGIEGALNFISPLKLFAFKAVKNLKPSDESRLTHLGKVYFLYLFVYSGLEFTVSFVTHYQHGFDSAAQGKMFAYLGVVMATVQGGFVRRIKAGKEKSMCVLGLCLMLPSFCIIGVSPTKFWLYVGLTLYGIGSSLIVPCLTALASQLGPDSQKGTILGIWRSLGALARALGPVVACFGFWSMGSSWTYIIGGLLLTLPIKMLIQYRY